jgi:acyl carrier protein
MAPDIATTVVAAIAEACGVDPAEVTARSGLYDELGVDSLAVMETLCALEEQLGIELPDSNEFALSLRTVADVVAAFAARAEGVASDDRPR